MSGTATYHLTAEHLAAGYRFNDRLAWRKPRTLFAVGMAIVLYTMIFLLIGGVSGIAAFRSFVIAAAIIGGFVFLVVMIRKWQIPRLAKRHFAQHKALQEAISLSWDADSIELRQPRSVGSHDWTGFIKWGETSELLLLYQTDIMFVLVPITALPEHGAEEITTFLTEAGVPRVGR